MCEVWNPKQFCSRHPSHRREPPLIQPWESRVRDNTNILPIHSLSHVTHNVEAAAIRETSLFIPRIKTGKALGRYDGSPVGETFKMTYYNPSEQCDTFTRIPPDSPVLPGRISWWGISSTNCRETELGRQFRARLVESKERMPGLVEASYLRDGHESDSRYGNREFTVSLSNLLKNYKRSRTDCKDKEVYLRNAGTLRYKYEICHVIMTAMEGDVADEDFPSMYDEPRFQDNGLIDRNGKLIDSSITPGFQIMHPFTQNYTKDYRVSYSWETLVFALYFPDSPQSVLECLKGDCKEKEINHAFCTKTKPVHPHEWKRDCPNRMHRYQLRYEIV